MKSPVEPRWEEQIRTTARAFVYPPTPDLATAVQARLAAVAPIAQPGGRQWRLGWALLLALVLLLAGLWAVPPVRAALLEWLQIGAVRIWLVESTPTPAVSGIIHTPAPTATPLASLFNLVGTTTLAEAQAKAGFPLRLPTYPTDLGAPTAVFFQDLSGPAVILVWMEPAQPTHARLSLHILGPNTFAQKGDVQRIAQTTVNGQDAFWTEGPYMLAYRKGNALDWDMRRVVEGHVLLWTEGDLTYRLESDLPLPEVVRIAESLR